MTSAAPVFGPWPSPTRLWFPHTGADFSVEVRPVPPRMWLGMLLCARSNSASSGIPSLPLRGYGVSVVPFSPKRSFCVFVIKNNPHFPIKNPSTFEEGDEKVWMLFQMCIFLRIPTIRNEGNRELYQTQMLPVRINKTQSVYSWALALSWF